MTEPTDIPEWMQRPRVPLETMEEIIRARHALPPLHLRPEGKVARFKAVQEALNKMGPAERASVAAELRRVMLEQLAQEGP
jgi:hypothetical protein